MMYRKPKARKIKIFTIEQGQFESKQAALVYLAEQLDSIEGEIVSVTPDIFEQTTNVFGEQVRLPQNATYKLEAIVIVRL